MRIAAMGDIHFRPDSDSLAPILEAVAADADILLLCGDLVDLGLPDEAERLVRELAPLRLPVLAVLGNHEYESGRAEEVRDILGRGRVRVLDGDAVEVDGVGFAGVKGFAGGFGERALQPWGEPAVKAFVREAVEETLKLESALAKLRTPQRIVLLHYSPIQATVEGEPREIFPFLGSSRLEEPIDRYGVAAVFHGHAHRGALEGRTRQHVPVYNVAVPLLRHMVPARAPFAVLEVPVEAEAVAAGSRPPAKARTSPTGDGAR